MLRVRVRMCGFKCEKTERLIQLQQSAAGAGKNVRVEMCILKTPRNPKKLTHPSFTAGQIVKLNLCEKYSRATRRPKNPPAALGK